MPYPDYSVSEFTSAGGNVALDAFQAALNDSAIGPACTHVNRNDNTVTPHFDAALDAGEQGIVDSLVAAHDGAPLPRWQVVHVPTLLRAIESGASEVVANDRPALEVQDGFTAFGASSFPWTYPEQKTTLRVHAHFILKSSGFGSSVRLAAKVKAQGVGEDSSQAFTPEGFTPVVVTYTTIGEVFEGMIDLDASGIEAGDSVALHVGRDGNNEMGGGTTDDVDVPIQIIDLAVEVA